MLVTVLGSGSEGNATLVEGDGVALLIDAGFSGRDLEQRIESVGVPISSLAGIVVTHDHGDHTRGMGILARRFGVPLYLTEKTRNACAALLSGKEKIELYASSQSFRIGPFEIQPFLTVHDAADPVAIAVEHKPTGARLGIATDLGRPTASVRASLRNCHMLVLEANHDEAMLWNGPYPWSVKQRIASSHGHLSNRAAADLARELFHPGLGAVVLAHLSAHCNSAGVALQIPEKVLDRLGFKGTLQVAPQNKPMEPVDVVALRRKHVRAEQLSLL
ncbi:MAG TPA: MBL fold metallo-hydrolase [Longimicrobiales bacterium]|nr:MBL fold metallo-hydrolase [Longimicrobiales bacterium]